MLNPKLGPPLLAQELERAQGRTSCREFLVGLVPPTALIIATLGSIVTGWARRPKAPRSAASARSLVTALHGKLTWAVFKDRRSAPRRPRAW
jgi:TRAP-type mannitol/chloroaromatic compound transport system permease large subunit